MGFRKLQFPVSSFQCPVIVLVATGSWHARVTTMRRRALSAVFVSFWAALLAPSGCASRDSSAVAQAPAPAQRSTLTAADDALLEDLSKRSFMFFWEQADPVTGIVRDRSRTDGSPVPTNARDVGSIASVGFGLSGLCIAAERGWVPRAGGGGSRASHAAVLRRQDGESARLVLPFREPAHRRAGVVERTVLDRLGAAAGRRPDGAAVLCRRRGGPAAR